MKANELMIGDWVEIQDTPKYYKVFGIDILAKGDACRLTFEDYVVDAWCDKISPIPLTEKILKANGFEFEIISTIATSSTTLIDNYTSIHFQFITNNNGGCFLRIEHCGAGSYNIEMMVKYVHELQRILRCCGLWELANNLKIK